MTPPSRKSCYNFRVVEINRVVDGDTIDATLDRDWETIIPIRATAAPMTADAL